MILLSCCLLISISLSYRVVAFDQPDLTQQQKYEERYELLLSIIVVDHPFIVFICVTLAEGC